MYIPTTEELTKRAFTVNNQNIKQATGIQVTFILGNKLQKEHYFSNIWRFFQRLTRPFSTLVKMGMWIRMTWPKSCKRRQFTTISQNKNQKTGIQVTFILEIKLQKYIFFIKIRLFLQRLIGPFWTFVRMGMCIGMLRLKNWKKKGFSLRSNWHPSELWHENHASKSIFIAKQDHFFSYCVVKFILLLG